MDMQGSINWNQRITSCQSCYLSNVFAVAKAVLRGDLSFEVHEKMVLCLEPNYIISSSNPIISFFAEMEAPILNTLNKN